jgi:Calcium-activated chloride channel
VRAVGVDACESPHCYRGSPRGRRTQLAVIFITRLVIGNFTEVILPYFVHLYKTSLYRRVGGFTCCGLRKPAQILDDDADEMSCAEKESFLATYDTFEDYLEMRTWLCNRLVVWWGVNRSWLLLSVIQFGYASLFVVAFPLAPLLALLNNYVEIRVDSFKVLNNVARPIPRGAQDIGKCFGNFCTAPVLVTMWVHRKLVLLFASSGLRCCANQRRRHHFHWAR